MLPVEVYDSVGARVKTGHESRRAPHLPVGSLRSYNGDAEDNID